MPNTPSQRTKRVLVVIFVSSSLSILFSHKKLIPHSDYLQADLYPNVVVGSVRYDKHTISDDDDDTFSNIISLNNDDNDDALSNIISLRNLLSSPDGVIHGDPTANPICQRALLQAENRDEQKILGEYQEQQQRFALASSGRSNGRYTPPQNLPHEFWSRESLSATIAPPGHNGLKIWANIFTTGLSKVQWTVSNYTSTCTDTFNRSIRTLEMTPFPLVGSSSNVSITIPTAAYLQIGTLHFRGMAINTLTD